MCIYRLEVSAISRSQNRNVVAAAAYRAGERLVDDAVYGTGNRAVFDYRRKHGVVATGVLLPVGGLSSLKDRETLWNAVERSETRKNSRLAREVLIALPHELTDAQREGATQALCAYLVERYGAGVDYALHRPSKNSDKRNHHAHILMTTRKITPEGLQGKIRVLDDKVTGPQEIERIRATWEKICNNVLIQANRLERVTRKSLEAQNIPRLPEPKQHNRRRQKERQAVKAYNASVGLCQRQYALSYVRHARVHLKRLKRKNKPFVPWLLRKRADIIRQYHRRTHQRDELRLCRQTKKRYWKTAPLPQSVMIPHTIPCASMVVPSSRRQEKHSTLFEISGSSRPPLRHRFRFFSEPEGVSMYKPYSLEYG